MLKFSLFLLLLNVSISYSQVNYTAVITEPQIGLQENANNLIKVVDDINNRENVKHVIVLGNITANGKFDEFIWAQEILDGLNVPYFVVGGEKDYNLSEGKGSEISLLWGDDKEIFYDKNYNLVCLNTILPQYSNKNHIEAETMDWFEDALQKSNSKRIITLSYYPIKKVTNSGEFYKTTIGNKLFSIVSINDKQKSEIPSLEGFYLNRKNDWGYLLITAKKDSVIIKKILGEEVRKKAKPEILYSVFTPITMFKSIKPVKTYSSENKLWSVNLNKTIQTSPVFSGDEIYACFKNGSIICFSGSGKEKWSYNTHGKINTSIIIENDLLVAATAEGDVLTLNSNTGNPVQVIGIGESISSDLTLFDFEEDGVNRKAIVLGTVYGNLYCYDLYSLEPLWTNQITNDWINSSIIYSNKKIFFQDREGTLFCLSSINGLLIWKMSATQGGWKTQNSGSESIFNKDIIVSKNSLYLLDAIGNLYCIDALLGTIQWNIKNIVANGLNKADSENDLIISTNLSTILTISIKSKNIVNEIELPWDREKTSITDLCIINNNTIISFDDGWIYQINPKQKPEKIFRGGSAPVISLTNFNGDCLVTDYDGNFTLLKISSNNK